MKFNSDSGRAILDLLIETVILAAVFLVPLWFGWLFPTYNIFEFNKLIIIKVLVWLLFLLTVLKLIFYPSRLNFAPEKFFKEYWLWPLVFIAGLSLALFFSDNPLLSFYGTPERQGGLVSYLFYFFWFILASFNILTVDNHQLSAAESKSKKIRRVAAVATLSATLVSVYGLLQILNIDFLSWPEPAFITHRVFSSFGQPNFLASWLLLTVPLSIYLGASARRFPAKSLYFLSAALQVICLVLTGSRGGLLALFFAAALYLIHLFLTAAWTRRRKLLAALGFIGSVFIFLVIANSFLPGRISSIFDYKKGSVGIRANFYSAAADAVKARPLFGYGLEGGSEIFIKYYQPDWAVYGEVGQSTNRAHNLILDILLNVGFYGLILFILLYYFFFSLAKDNFGKKRQPALSLALALGAAAYLFSLLFSFAIVAGEFYFWLFLALLAAINSGSDETRDGEGTSLSVKIGYPLKIIIAVGLIFLTFWRLDATFKSLKADYYFKNIYSALAEPDYPAALFLDAVLRTQKANPANQASYDRLLTEKLSGLYPLIENAEIKKAVQGKLAAVAANLPDSGYENLLVKAKAANTLGKYYEARAYLNRIITLAPYWPLVYLEQGKLAANQGDDKGALVAYNLALLNLPDAGDSRLNGSHLELVRHYQYLIYYRIGDIYGQESNYAAAEKYYRSAYQSDPDDFVLLKKIADMNYRRGDFKTALEYTAHGLARNPRDYKWSVALATLYYESGDKQSARKYLDQALKLAPDNREILDLKKTYGQ